MDNKEQIKHFAEETIKNVTGLLGSFEKTLDSLKSDLTKDHDMVAKLANEMKLAEASDRIQKLKEEIKNIKV